MQLQHQATACSRDVLQQTFISNGEDMEKVEVFKYLGRMLAYDNNDTQAMQANLKKVWRCWSWILQVLRAENAAPQVCSVFYKATVMAVLLYGSKTWNLAPSTLKNLKGFHIQAARHMAGKRPWKSPDRS